MLPGIKGKRGTGSPLPWDAGTAARVSSARQPVPPTLFLEQRHLRGAIRIQEEKDANLPKKEVNQLLGGRYPKHFG